MILILEGIYCYWPKVLKAIKNVFRNLLNRPRKISLNPMISMTSKLKTKVKLELLTDIDMFSMIEKRIR